MVQAVMLPVLSTYLEQMASVGEFLWLLVSVVSLLVAKSLSVAASVILQLAVLWRAVLVLVAQQLAEQCQSRLLMLVLVDLPVPYH
jgi:hypothetical protein